MKRYDPKRGCPKCGYVTRGVYCTGGYHTLRNCRCGEYKEHMHRYCSCGYDWAEACLDAEPITSLDGLIAKERQCSRN